jgi:hypothetical protein
MKLFIRSQRKDCLREVHSIECNVDREGCCVLDGCYILGEYKTKERCIEIIDEIQNLLLSANEDYLIKLQDIDVNAEEKTVYGETFIKRLQSPIMPIANEPSVQFIQPSVLVYEMPKE